MLNGVKQSLSQALDAERASWEKSKLEVKELTQKLRSTKAALQVCHTYNLFIFKFVCTSLSEVLPLVWYCVVCELLHWITVCMIIHLYSSLLSGCLLHTCTINVFIYSLPSI